MSLPKANKKLGQHFLKNPQVIENITQSHPSMDFDFILEIGPGPAILSKKLIAHNKKYIAVEKDQRFIEMLIEIPGDTEIINQDALIFNIDEHLKLSLIHISEPTRPY